MSSSDRHLHEKQITLQSASAATPPRRDAQSLHGTVLTTTRDASRQSREFTNTLDNQNVKLYNATIIRGCLPSFLTKFLPTRLVGVDQKGIPHTWRAPQGPGEAKFLYDVGIMFGFLLNLLAPALLGEEKEHS